MEAQYSLCLWSLDDVVRDQFEERHRAGLVEGGAVRLMDKYFLAAMQLLCFTGDKDKMTRTI